MCTPLGVYVAAVLAPVALLNVVPFVDRCHWYVIAPMPPLALVVEVNAAGVVPEHIVWLTPILPGFSAGATVIFTTLERKVPQEALVALRR